MTSLNSEFFFIDTLKKIKKEDWNKCVGNDHPFIQHEFLLALEVSKSACKQKGWKPHHYIEYDEEKKIIAACPLYLKDHSYGEYIFDHAWAEAYERYGLNYYPKLQSAIPFTPVTGERIIIHPSIKSKSKKREEILNNIIEEAKKINVSSVHFNFISKPTNWLINKKIMIREGIQYHWKNNDYNSFNDFLKNLSSRKRKQIKKERLCLIKNNLKVKHLIGDKIKNKHMEFFYKCYQDTTGKKWGSQYLNKEFFFKLLSSFNKNILLIIAYEEEEMVASAINFFNKTHLYGRLWGSMCQIPFLHFELCYYQAIDFAIKNKIKIVEAGAQGEHKIQRGYMPEKIWSAHWIKNNDFKKAIEKFLYNEKKLINSHKKNLEQFNPYKII